MLRSTLLAVLLATLIGCGGNRNLRPDLQGGPTDGGNWFCQMAEGGEGWQCVQDPALAERPKPDRLPAPQALEPPAQAAPGPPQAPPPIAPVLAEPAPGPAPESAEPDPPAGGDAPPPPEPDLPRWLALAYQPPAPVPLTELPEEFYAVQLVAVSSPQALERYVTDYNLPGLSGARVERNGRLFYVLLLGIYESRELAERASDDLPPPLDRHTPWIRRLGTLQQAMRRGDALAAAN